MPRPPATPRPPLPPTAMAGQHMAMLGDPLAKAIVAKLPDKFR